MRTLLLNIGYEPIGLISWQDAITLWYTDKIDILEEYDAPLRSCYIEMKMPAVVRLRMQHRYDYSFIPLERRFVYARDSWTCQYCGQRFPDDQLSYDHVVPQCRGGRTTWENVVTACEPCNNRKDDRTPVEAEMQLIRKPKKPRWLPAALVDLIGKNEVPNQWMTWIGWVRH